MAFSNEEIAQHLTENLILDWLRSEVAVRTGPWTPELSAKVAAISQDVVAKWLADQLLARSSTWPKMAQILKASWGSAGLGQLVPAIKSYARPPSFRTYLRLRWQWRREASE